MRAESAREATNFCGWILLGASFLQLPGLMIGAELRGTGGGSLLLLFFWGLFALATGTAIALIYKSRIGFYLLYVETLLSFVGPRISFVPFIGKYLPAGPEQDYWAMGVNIAMALFIAFLHWSIAAEDDEPWRKRSQMIVKTFLVLLIPGLIYWKAGIVTGDDEAPRISGVPLVGEYLAPLESTQPVLYRSLVSPRSQKGTVVFRGVTTTNNLQKFAVAYDLKLMTNHTERAKFLPILKTWKLDPERFPLFNGPADLCYIGRVPKDSHMALQICHRPGDGRFVGLAIGSPRKKR